MKNLMLSVLAIITVALFSMGAQAQNKKVLLISDIDDTIKVSHVLSTTQKITRALDFTTAFTGMSQLYQLIINQNFYSTRVAYISNAPLDIAGTEIMRISHENFLSYNHFPKGDLLLRKDINDQNHKIHTIRELVKNQKPDLVIMIGDNGERDTEIYELAAQELNAAGIRNETYIHQLYSSGSWFFEIGQKLLAGQIGYVTPFEIALDLKNKNLFDQKSFDWMTEKLMPFILKEDITYFDIDAFSAMTFPDFMDCSDYKWTSIVPPALVPLASKINKLCR